jgi:hypothetical protein
MKTLYNFLVPPFLQRTDDYLLHHYPVVWRAKVVFVLFYGIIVAVVLFTAGFVYPVDAQHLTVEPIKPIEMSKDSYHSWSILFISWGIYKWFSSQYELSFPFTKFKDTLLTLSLYAICFLFLFGFVTPALRFGTIIRTANFWMNEEDMHELENSGIYPYGFALAESDTIYNIAPSDTFLQNREIQFKEIYKKEDTLLTNIYSSDTTFWIKKLLVSDNVSDLNYWLNNKLNRSFVPSGSPLASNAYIPFLFKYFRKLNSSNPGWNYVIYNQFRSTDFTKFGIPADTFYYKLLKTYSQRKVQHLPNKFSKYNFNESIDSVKSLEKSQTFNPNNLVDISYPCLPYSVENAVRSVKNAKLYLKTGAITRYWEMLFSYVLLASILLYFCHLLKFKQTVMFSFLNIAFFSIFIATMPKYKEINNSILETIFEINSLAYILVPTISIIFLLLSIFEKKQFNATSSIIHLLFTSILLLMFTSLFSHNDYLVAPYNPSFYGVQALSLIGAFLTTYVRTLPKE